MTISHLSQTYFQAQQYDNLPQKIKDYFAECCAVTRDKALAVEEKIKRKQHINYISANIFALKIIAHNGSRFDLPALQDELFKFVDVSQLKAIRKGSSFFALSIGQLTFMDSMHFVPNMSLAKFCQTFEVPTPKGLWPYEHFKSAKEILKCTTYPSIRAFYSSLSKEINSEKIASEFEEFQSNFSSPEKVCEFFGIEDLNQELFVSPKEYYHAKKEFDEKIDNGEYTSMFCVLKSYNLNDCRILHHAMVNFCKMVKLAFNAEVLSKLTLPGLAEG